MMPLDDAWGGAVRAAVAGSIVLASGSVGLALVRGPVYRARLASWTLGGALLVPFLGGVPAVPRWQLAVGSAAEVARRDIPAPRPVVAPSPFRDPEPDAARTRDRPEPSPPPSPSPPPAPRRLDPRGLVLAAWGLVGLGWLGWWGLGLILLARACRSARPAGAAVRSDLQAIAGPGAARVRLLVSDRVPLPVTFTWLRPTILLPAGLIDGGDPRDLRFALAHEWSHVERQDYWSWTLGSLTGTLWAVHPLYWLVRRQLRLSQDYLADDRAAGVESPEEFAATLVRLARARLDRARFPLPALSFGGRPSHLTRRVLMLLLDRPPLARRCRPAWTATAATLAGLILVGSAGLRLDAAPPAAGPMQQTALAPNSEQPLDVNIHGFKYPAPPDLLAPAPGSREWSGRVVDQATGQPIAGAEVWVDVGRFDPQLGEFHPGREVLATTVADGSFRFALTAEEQADPLLFLKLTTSHPDHITDRDSNQYAKLLEAVGRGERPSFERIELAPARPVEGVVLDPAGATVDGVKVVARSNRGENTWVYEAVRTDARGRFRVPVALQGAGVLWILAGQNEPLKQVIPADRRGDLGTFRLGRGVRLRGRVLDVGGRPVGGIFVDARVLDDPAPSRNNPFRHYDATIGRSTETLADGTFALDPLPPGLIELRPHERRSFPMNFQDDATDRGKPDRSEYRALPGVFLPQEVRIGVGQEPGPLAIRAVPEVRLTAQLLNNRGVKQGFDTAAQLTGMIDGWAWTGQARPDGSGLIALIAPRGLERPRFQVMANQYRKLLYRTGRDAPLLPQLDLPRVLDRDLGEIEVVSSVNAVVRVRVTDGEGKAIKGVTTSVATVARAPVREGPGFTEEGLTMSSIVIGSADGRTWTHWLEPDREVEVKVTAAGFKPASRRVTLPEGKTEEVTFVLEPR